MQIKILFAAYHQQIAATPNSSVLFEQSGMVNASEILDLGFFPIGSGVFTEKSKIEEAEIQNCHIMVLGNDFGTQEYIDRKCPNKKEKRTNPTIKNLFLLNLDAETTFFTNLFMGLRIGNLMVGEKDIQSEYEKFCLTFFQTQLDFAKPKIVLCLGKEVEMSLSKLYFKQKINADGSGLKTFVDANGLKFIFIPHPSYAHINWKRNDVQQKIVAALDSPTSIKD